MSTLRTVLYQCHYIPSCQCTVLPGQVAYLQGPGVWDPMAHALVDAGAHGLGEAPVVKGGGVGPGVNYHLVYHWRQSRPSSPPAAQGFRRAQDRLQYSSGIVREGHRTIQCYKVPYRTIQHDTTPYSTKQYHPLRTVHHYTVLFFLTLTRVPTRSRTWAASLPAARIFSTPCASWIWKSSFHFGENSPV